MKEKRGEHPLGDLGQLISLGLFLLIWVGDSFFLRISTFLSDDVPFYVRMAILAAAVLTALYLAGSGHVVVSHKHRPNRVVSNGAFRYVRHPLYLASILSYFGLASSTVSLFSFALLVPIFFFHDFIATYEEELLLQKYGSDYVAYREKTGKWLPRIGRTR